MFHELASSWYARVETMKIPTLIEKLPTGTIVAIHWDCGCEWDAGVGQIICKKHQEDPEA